MTAPDWKIMQDAALECLDHRHWSVMPISPDGKKPTITWKPYQTRLPPRPNVSRWFDGEDGEVNLGLITGELSGRVVLDVDEAIGLEEIERRGGLPLTQTVQTRPDIAHKLHFHFAWPGRSVANFAKEFKIGGEVVSLPGLDFRGDGGYVMLPPSKHWSGAGRYAWLRGLEEAPLAPLPPWLRDLLFAREDAKDAAPIMEAVPLLPDGEGADELRKWALGALASEQGKMVATPDGEKHQRRFNAARALGGIAAHGLLSDVEITDALSVNFGKDKRGALDTIRDGITSGRAAARSLPQPRRARSNSRPFKAKPPPDMTSDTSADAPLQFDTRPLPERGILPETMRQFHIARAVCSNAKYADYVCFEYPVLNRSGRITRSRQFVLDPLQTGGARYLTTGAGKLPLAYNLPECENALRDGALDVWITDAELSTWHLHQIGVAAVSPFNLHGAAGGILKELARMGARRVQICTGNTHDGAHAALQFLAAAKKAELTAIARALPGPVGFTLADLRGRCKTDEAFREAVRGLSALSPAKLEAVLPPRDEADAPKPPSPTDKAERLLELLDGLQGSELFHTETGEAYIALPRSREGSEWRETFALKEERFNVFCRHFFHKTTNKIPDGGVIDNALGVLDGRARFERPLTPVHTRTAGYKNRVYLDLGDEHWNCVEIGEDVEGGWRVMQKPPVHFRRAPGMEALPMPKRGGRWEDLRALVNVGSDANWILFVSWLLMSLRPADFPYPVLAVHGEQETGKTTLCKVARRLIDPNFTDLLNGAAIDRRDLAIIGKNSFVIGFDNLSKMSLDVNDALCSLVTEGSFRTRKLRTDDEEALFKARRPVVLNGINENLGQNDFRRRCVKLQLEPMGAQKRDEEEVWRDFHRLHPYLLGLLCDAICVSLTFLPGVELKERFGLLDFRRWVEAGESALPWETGQFAPTYRDNLMENIESANEADPFTLCLIGYVDHRGPFSGTAEHLRDELHRFASDIAKSDPTWPKSAQTFGSKLARIAPNLLAIGIQVERMRPGGHRLLKIRRLAGTKPTNLGVEETE